MPLQMFARDLLTLLHEAGGRMLLLNFDTAYLDRFGKFSAHWILIRYMVMINSMQAWTLESFYYSEYLYENCFFSGVACRPATYGFPNIVALVQALGDLVAVRGRGTKRILVLNRDSAPSPPSFHIPTSR